MTIDHRQSTTPPRVDRTDPPAGFTAAERLAVAAILGGAFMVVLDFFIVIVALPSIQRELGATPAMLGLVVAAYAAATASGLVAGGRLGDRFGRKATFLVGLACFTAASVGCGLSRSPAELVTLRVLQGLAGALVQPQVLALLGAGFAGRKRARVFAWYAMAMGVAGVLAQVLGGLVIELDLGGLGWRGCFLINLPIGGLGLLLAARAVQETPRQPTLAMDLPGSALLGATLGLLVLALTAGREAGFPPWALAALALAAASAAAFAWHERRLDRRGQPGLVPARLLAAPGFGRGALAVLLFYSAVASLYFVLGLHLQQTLGLTPLMSGGVFAVLGAAFFAASMLGARVPVSRRVACMVGGAALAAAGHLWQLLAHAAFPGATGMVPGLLAEGAGIGMVMAPLLAAVLATSPAADAGVAAGILATMQQVGNALGVAAISSVRALGAPDPSMAAAPSGFTLSMLYLAAVCSLLGVALWRGRERWLRAAA